MPLYMRLGKLRGPNHKKSMPMGPFRTHTTAVNVRDLGRFDAGVEVTPELLKAAGVIKHLRHPVKILGYRRARQEADGARPQVLQARDRADRGRRRHGHGDPVRRPQGRGPRQPAAEPAAAAENPKPMSRLRPYPRRDADPNPRLRLTPTLPRQA